MVSCKVLALFLLSVRECRLGLFVKDCDSRGDVASRPVGSGDTKSCLRFLHGEVGWIISSVVSGSGHTVTSVVAIAKAIACLFALKQAGGDHQFAMQRIRWVYACLAGRFIPLRLLGWFHSCAFPSCGRARSLEATYFLFSTAVCTVVGDGDLDETGFR